MNFYRTLMPQTNFHNLMHLKSLALMTVALSALMVSCGPRTAKQAERIPADFPLYIDPVYNGSTDPMVCYNPNTGTYYMYYTSRRSNVEGLGGIESVHGSPIGIAESTDGGASWTYLRNADIDYAHTRDSRRHNRSY